MGCGGAGPNGQPDEADKRFAYAHISRAGRAGVSVCAASPGPGGPDLESVAAMKKDKLKVRELISRATYKTVKNMNREDMNEWAKMLYNDALRDCEAASMLSLKDEFGFSTVRLARFMDRRNNIIISINKRLISADEIIQGLISEGVVIVESDGSVPGGK